MIFDVFYVARASCGEYAKMAQPSSPDSGPTTRQKTDTLVGAACQIQERTLRYTCILLTVGCNSYRPAPVKY